MTTKRWGWGFGVLWLILAGGCKNARCGNGVVDPGEACDGGDRCDATCQVRACYPGANGNGNACFPLVEASDIGDGDYDYPAPYRNSDQYSAPVRFVDAVAVDASRQVAANFTLDEFIAVSNGRYGVVQTHAVARVQAVRSRVGPLRISSGFRSPGYNASIPGSATSSRHQYGDGFDLVPTDADLPTLGQTCDNNGADFSQIYESHVHCDWRLVELDPAFYGMELMGQDVDVPIDIASVRAVRPAMDAHVELVDDEDGWALAAPATGWDEGEPLREWTAYDDGGHVIDMATSRTYVPPPDAVEVDVEVGRELVRTFAL